MYLINRDFPQLRLKKKENNKKLNKFEELFVRITSKKNRSIWITIKIIIIQSFFKQITDKNFRKRIQSA